MKNSLIGTLITLLILTGIELTFRSIGLGKPEPYFITYKADTSYWVFNPAISQRIFYRGDEFLLPQVDPFLKVKPRNTIRIFVLGASTAYGFPYTHNTSFPRILKRSLGHVTDANSIEIINLSLTAINTYTLRELSKELVKFDADATVIYAGHNEFHGVHGVASSYSIASQKIYKEVYFVAKRLQFFNWLESKFKFSDSKEGDANLMQKLANGQFIELNSNTFKQGVEQFESNLIDIISIHEENNIPVFIGKLTSNIVDIQPLDFTSSKDKKLKSLNHYVTAQDQLNKKDALGAIENFSAARDLDQLRFRAPSHFNEIIDKLKTKKSITVVNVDSVFQSMRLTSNETLFLEHVHPNVKGYYLMAYSFHLKITESQIFKELTIQPETISFENYYSLFAPVTTKLDSAVGDVLTQRLLTQWPFYGSQKQFPNTLESNIAQNALEQGIPWTQMMDIYYKECMAQKKYGDAKRTALSLMLEIPFSDVPIKYYLDCLLNSGEYSELLGYASTYIYELNPNRRMIANYISETFKSHPDLAQLKDFLDLHIDNLGEFGFHLEGILDNRIYREEK